MDISLTATEQVALQKLAYEQKRKAKDQASIIIRNELIRLGLIKPPKKDI